MDGGDHVPARGAADGVAGNVERDGGRGRAQGDAQHRHGVPLAQAGGRRLDRGRLQLRGRDLG